MRETLALAAVSTTAPSVPESSITYRSASGPSLVFSGTGTTPARIAPNMVSANSIRLLIDIASRSPGLNPSRASVEATRSSRDCRDGRLRTTFDLIEKGGKFSSKSLEDALHEIRKLKRSLGKEHGRVVLKAAKPHLEERLANFREDLKLHQQKVEKELQVQLNESRGRIEEYFVPRVVASPPNDMRGRYLRFGRAEARVWLDDELAPVLPKAETLLQKMQLDVHYKDVTFETLNRPDFLDAIR
jgi:hypothetical protein